MINHSQQLLTIISQLLPLNFPAINLHLWDFLPYFPMIFPGDFPFDPGDFRPFRRPSPPWAASAARCRPPRAGRRPAAAPRRRAGHPPGSHHLEDFFEGKNMVEKPGVFLHFFLIYIYKLYIYRGIKFDIFDIFWYFWPTGQRYHLTFMWHFMGKNCLGTLSLGKQYMIPLCHIYVFKQTLFGWGAIETFHSWRFLQWV